MRVILGDIFILHLCITNDDHMMYGFWDIERDRYNLLSFWAIFCTLTPLTKVKNQNFEKIKKIPADTIILHMCTINENRMMYGSWDM